MRINTIDRGGIIPPRILETLDIPQRVGLYLTNVKTGAREIDVGVTIIGVSYEEIQDRKEIIGEILRTNEPVPIVFDDEPDRTYYGMLSGDTILDEKNTIGKGSIKFLCPDPHKYGEEEIREFTGGGSLDFLNGTNTDIFPTYEITFRAPSTFLAIMSDEKQITIGDPAAVDQVVVPREQQVLSEPFTSLSGWTAANTTVGGIVAGTIKVDQTTGGNFVPESFGTGEGWHGPALMKSLPEPLTDFQLEVYLENKSTGVKGSKDRAKQLGRAEIYLLDVNNKMIAKFAIADTTLHMEETVGEARLGGTTGGLVIMNYKGDGKIWNEFDGRILVSRVNNRWAVTIGQFDWATKRHHSRFSAEHLDVEGKFNQQVAKVEVHFAQHTNHPTTKMLLDTMRVWKINTVTRPEIPYIVEAGDVVEVETATGGIYKNGVPWMSELNPLSEFFPLKPGTTPLAFLPGEAATVAMTYKKRWL